MPVALARLTSPPDPMSRLPHEPAEYSLLNDNDGLSILPAWSFDSLEALEIL